MPKRLNDDETRAIVAARLSRTLDSTDSELRADRENALNFYYGRPLGNEIDGRAQVVTKDVMDTIEWMMPSLIRALDNPHTVQFDPVGPEDEQQATHESLYIRHVVWKKNPGWRLMYNWLKDALMQKVGYAHYWWDDGKKHSFDEYENLTDDQLIVLGQEMQANGIEAKIMQASQEDGLWSIKVRKTRSYPCAKWSVYPPDEVIVDKDCDGDIKQARSVFHTRKRVTRSELVEMGFSKKRVADLTSYDWRADTEESRARDTVDETSHGEVDEEDSDPASKELEILRCWTYIDKDGDGIAELRYLMLAGNDTLIDEECPEIPWCSITPTPIPHRHHGLSIYDMIEDLQRINTALNRGLLDNTYFTQNPRVAFNRRTVDWKALGVNRPGGHVPVDGPPAAGDLMPIPVVPMQERILPVIQHFAEMRENRVGVGKMTAGLDADTLGRATKGAYINAQTTSSQRIEMIAAVFANTGICDLYSSLHRLSMRHQDRTTHEKLDGKWVPISPMEWMDRTNFTIRVGATSKDEIRTNLTLMATAQQQAGQLPGLIQPKNAYALFRDMQDALGLTGKPYITDPESDEYKQWEAEQAEKAKNPPPDPYVQVENQKTAQRAQQANNDAQLQAKKLGVDTALKVADLELKYSTDLAAPGIGAELNGRGGGAAGAPRPAAPQ